MLMSAELSETAVSDFYFSDDFQQLPRGYGIKNKEIRNCRECKDFYISDDNGKKTFIKMDKSIQECFYAYYELWENYHYFGLPHGKGWINELPWVVDFLKYYDKIYNEIEVYRIEKRRR